MPQASMAASRIAKDKGARLYLMDFDPELVQLEPGDFWQASTDRFGEQGNLQLNIKIVNSIVDHFGCHAILSDGSHGLVYGCTSVPAKLVNPFQAESVVDSTGAGDLFRAGMIHGLVKRWPIEKCLEFASAVGCLSVSRLGGVDSARSEEETLNFIENHTGNRKRR